MCVCVWPYGAVVCAVDFQSKHCGFDPCRVRFHTSFFSFSISGWLPTAKCVCLSTCGEKKKKKKKKKKKRNSHWLCQGCPWVDMDYGIPTYEDRVAFDATTRMPPKVRRLRRSCKPPGSNFCTEFERRGILDTKRTQECSLHQNLQLYWGYKETSPFGQLDQDWELWFSLLYFSAHEHIQVKGFS